MTNWIEVAKFDEIEEGEPFFYDFAYETVALIRVGDQLFAIEDRCTHDDGPLAEGVVDTTTCEIECPRHGARFDLKTGDALSLPASQPVPTYAFKVEDGSVFVREPEE